MCIFIRYFDNVREQFVENILIILPMLGTTFGKDIYKIIIEYYDKYGFDMKKTIYISTDTILYPDVIKKSLFYSEV